MTTIFDLYEYRGELLDTAADAALKERPFYLQSSLDDINDQIRLLENITPEAHAEWLGESPDDPDGTEPSPIILGGEVLYRNYQSSDDIPF